jgi:GMP synthase-like glutamine amidotransferase
MSLRIQIFQHVEFEGPALIGDWAAQNNHQITLTRFFASDTLPEIGSFDLLIVLGGPMGVYDVEQYPWLKEEIDFIRETLNQKTPALGICLGAQLIAAALGAKVYQGGYKEIGWFPLSILKDNFPLEVQSEIPAEPVVFHWHGDTFDLPENSKVLASSTATPHQAFIHNDNVIGLQFHLETTNQAVKNLLEHAGDEVVEGRYIQTPEQMLTTRQYIEANRKFLCTILDYLCKRS